MAPLGGGRAGLSAAVARAQRGDAEAFDQLITPLLPRALHLARRLLGSLEDAEDLVQDACLRALERIFQVLHWIAPAHGLDAVFAEIRLMILQELDFSLEAKSLVRIAENFSRARPALPASGT